MYASQPGVGMYSTLGGPKSGTTYNDKSLSRPPGLSSSSTGAMAAPMGMSMSNQMPLMGNPMGSYPMMGSGPVNMGMPINSGNMGSFNSVTYGNDFGMGMPYNSMPMGTTSGFSSQIPLGTGMSPFELNNSMPMNTMPMNTMPMDMGGMQPMPMGGMQFMPMQNLNLVSGYDLNNGSYNQVPSYSQGNRGYSAGPQQQSSSGGGGFFSRLFGAKKSTTYNDKSLQKIKPNSPAYYGMNQQQPMSNMDMMYGNNMGGSRSMQMPITNYGGMDMGMPMGMGMPVSQSVSQPIGMPMGSMSMSTPIMGGDMSNMFNTPLGTYIGSVPANNNGQLYSSTPTFPTGGFTMGGSSGNFGRAASTTGVMNGMSTPIYSSTTSFPFMGTMPMGMGMPMGIGFGDMGGGPVHTLQPGQALSAADCQRLGLPVGSRISSNKAATSAPAEPAEQWPASGEDDLLDA